MPRPRLKRLLRVSLRMMFVLATILCVWLGFKVHQVKQQREAVARLREVDGYAGYDYEIDDLGGTDCQSRTPRTRLVV